MSISLKKDPFMFSGSLRLNLDPFEEHTDTEIWTALENVSLKEYVETLNNKLLFECSEGGDNMRY